jgi:hypothetical protein
MAFQTMTAADEWDFKRSKRPIRPRSVDGWNVGRSNRAVRCARAQGHPGAFAL